ncbi:ribonuclease P protein component [Candidatus Tisiphia endosymbiont of Nemotelus uliginosus]|uniref:ribonuclease P protein component n=1 Tax=Candidatus Tisiphia endosymbiont of Nemotelus uliginosus TaxID=3077926 RepID=UPI0035C8FA75
MFITSLKNQKEFDLVNKAGKKFHCSYFIAIITKDFAKITYHNKLPEQNNNIFFWGMKVGKKLSKSAVTRNKIKRRIRHLVRLLVNAPEQDGSNHPLQKIIEKHNWGMIIIPRKGFEKFLFASLLQEMKKIFSKL